MQRGRQARIAAADHADVGRSTLLRAAASAARGGAVAAHNEGSSGNGSAITKLLLSEHDLFGKAVRLFRIMSTSDAARASGNPACADCCGLVRTSRAGPCSAITPWSRNSTRSATSWAKRHLVGHDHHGHAVLGERAHHRQHLADQLGIERGGRLVEQDRLRLHRERAGDRDALLLSAGERGRIGVAPCRRARRAASRARPRAAPPPRACCLLHVDRSFDDVLQRGAVRKQVEALEHHRDLGADR